MAWRMALDRQRSNRRRTAREDQVVVDVVVSTGSVEANERAAPLWQAIDGLSEKLRIVIVLAGIEGHDIREIAVLLDLPEGTVKSRLFLARQQLKDALSWMNETR
jgi:RNA polymerase sigma-70 factor (ECF subfamily)